MNNEMQNSGVVEETKSSWTSPIVLVRKKDGSTKFYVNYRRLNDGKTVTPCQELMTPKARSGHRAMPLLERFWQNTILERHLGPKRVC